MCHILKKKLIIFESFHLLITTFQKNENLKNNLKLLQMRICFLVTSQKKSFL